MIPYFPQPVLRVGALEFYSFGALVGIGLFAGGGVFLGRVRRHGLNVDFARRFIWTVAVGGLIGAHFLGAALFDSAALTEWPPHSIFSFAGVATGLTIAAILLWHREGEKLQMLDSLTIGFNFGWIFGRLGCFFAHDHIGIASTSWIAVRFPDGPQLDLGLIECLFSAALAVVFALLDRRVRPPGFFFEWYLLLYGLFRIVRGALEVHHANYAGLIADQWLGLGLLLLGLLVRIVRCRKTKRGFSRSRLLKPL